jgi:ADP-ribosyl-[dinitrogen reductase] hydrolase
MRLAGTGGLEAIVDAVTPRPDEKEKLHDRYRGVMLGLGAGNALGLPVEGESQHSLRRHFPQGITDIDPREVDGPLDDDVAQAVILARLLVEREVLDPKAFAAHLVTWAHDNGRGMGNLTRAVIAELASGQEPQEAARLAWERNPMSAAGNGAVMRCAPIALRHLTSGAELVRAARTSALVTHYDARCEWSTVVTTVGIATCVAGNPVPLGDLAAAVDAVGGEGWPAEAVEQVAEAIPMVDAGDLESLNLDDPMDMGYTLKAMQVALWCMLQSDDFERIVTDVVSSGGDTDTNGALAGAVMGARCGASAIPERWLDNIPDKEKLADLADRLYGVCLNWS